MSLGGTDHTVHIVPEESVLLDVRTKFPCTVKGCDRTLTSYGALRMHRVKTHKLYQNEADLALAQKLKLKNCPKCVYHCPVANCHKSLRQGEKTSFFTSMKLLKQHYGKLHAEKKFVCEKCSRGFGLERDKRRHEQTCGFILRCKSCDCPYSTAEAMITHCRRKDHTPPDECLPKAKQKNGMKTKEAAQAYPHPPAQNIFVFNVLPSPNSTLNLPTEATEGFRQILPKPIIQRTVSLPNVTTAGKTELTDVEGLAAKHSVDTQTVVRQVEQGTSVNSELFTQAGISTGVQTTEGHGNRVDSRVSGNLETRGNQHVFSCMARRVCDLSYFNEISSTINQRDGGLEKVGISPRSSLLSSKNTGKLKVNSSTQHELAADMIGKDSANLFNMSDSISSTKGMQTLMSLPLKSQLSLAVAETQTPGDYILKQAMASANLSMGKVSKGSQVSPRSKGRGQKKVVPVNSQSCQTARLTEHKSARRKKHRKSVSSVNKDFTGNNSKHRNNHRRVNTSVSCGFSSACICCVNSHPNRNYLEVFLHRAGKVTGGRSSCGEFSHTVTQSSHCDKVRSRVDCQCNSLKHSVQAEGNSSLQGSESMLPDGPHDDDGIQASLAEFDDFTDNQTQTIGILEELNSLAATISTQTADSYLTQPTETTTTTTHNVGSEQASQTQHNHTQTFMSAFTPLTCNMPLSGNHDEHYGDVFPTRSVLYSQAAPISASLPSRCDKTKDLPNPLNSHGLSQPTPSSQVQSSGESSLTLPVDKTLSYVDSMCGSEAAELCNNSTAYSRDGYCVGGSLGASNKVTIAHADAQTTATDLLNLLDTGIQADSGPGTTIQTQTDVDEMWQLFCHNMETQTVDTDLLLQDLGFSDIQIQTNLDLEYLDDNSSTVETQTMWHSMSAASGGNVPQSDMQTQTRFSSSTFDPSLTDSHTQTPWEDLTSLLLQDL